jgi:hypothetical protein
LVGQSIREVFRGIIFRERSEVFVILVGRGGKDYTII